MLAHSKNPKMDTPLSALTDSDKIDLLQIARDSIRHGLHKSKPVPVDLELCSLALREPAAVFVTLTIEDELRGCIGTLESGLALAANVAHFAHAVAYSDSRFPPLTPMEFDSIHIHISILSPMEIVIFESESDLLLKIRPGIDGLLLEDAGRRATFLPSVWEKIPDPGDFLRKLKIKAGFSPSYWSPHIQVRRYTTMSVE